MNLYFILPESVMVDVKSMREILGSSSRFVRAFISSGLFGVQDGIEITMASSKIILLAPVNFKNELLLQFVFKTILFCTYSGFFVNPATYSVGLTLLHVSEEYLIQCREVS